MTTVDLSTKRFCQAAGCIDERKRSEARLLYPSEVMTRPPVVNINAQQLYRHLCHP
ncbi:hypothetical protein KFU94_06550 [Chloroflexi bacterium TSY]|nr:hypothetical protein [Chloroflexi bacterium TSY]